MKCTSSGQTRCTLKWGGGDMVLLSWQRAACINQREHRWAEQRRTWVVWKKGKKKKIISMWRTRGGRLRWIREMKSWSRNKEGTLSASLGFIEVCYCYICVWTACTVNVYALIWMHMCMCVQLCFASQSLWVRSHTHILCGQGKTLRAQLPL